MMEGGGGNDYLGVWKRGKEGGSEKGGVEGKRGMSYDERPCFLFFSCFSLCLFLVLFLSGFFVAAAAAAATAAR
jgi:hypothetical protein